MVNELKMVHRERMSTSHLPVLRGSISLRNCLVDGSILFPFLHPERAGKRRSAGIPGAVRLAHKPVAFVIGIGQHSHKLVTACAVNALPCSPSHWSLAHLVEVVRGIAFLHDGTLAAILRLRADEPALRCLSGLGESLFNGTESG